MLCNVYSEFIFMAIGLVKLTQRERYSYSIGLVVLNTIQIILGLVTLWWSTYVCLKVSPSSYAEKIEVMFVFIVIAVFGTHVVFHGLFGMQVCYKCYNKAHKKSTRKLVFVWILVGCNVLIDVFIIAKMSKKITDHVINAIKRSLENGMVHYLKDSFWKYTIDNLQIQMKCCGISSYKDWYKLSWIDEYQIDPNHALVTELRLSPSKFLLPIVPWSCCDVDYPFQCFHDPFQQIESSYLWVEEPAIVESSLYNKGCLLMLSQPIKTAITGYIVINIFMFIFMISGMLLSRIIYTSCRNNLILQHSSGIAPGWIFGRGDFGWAKGPTLDEIMQDVSSSRTSLSTRSKNESASKSKSSKKTKFLNMDQLSNFSKVIKKKQKARKSKKKHSQQSKSEEDTVSSSEEKALML